VDALAFPAEPQRNRLREGRDAGAVTEEMREMRDITISGTRQSPEDLLWRVLERP